MASPSLGPRMVSRRNIEAKRLKGETKLLVIDDHNLMNVLTWVEVIPAKEPIGITSSLRFMEGDDVRGNRFDYRQWLNRVKLRIDVMSVRLGVRQIPANIVEELDELEYLAIQRHRLAEKFQRPVL